jgi:uncharacterized protein YkwD
MPAGLIARLLGLLGPRPSPWPPPRPMPPPRPTPPPAPAPPPVPAAFRPQDLVDAFNVERARVGMGSLKNDASLNRAAQDWADELARRGVLDHGNFWGRIHAAMPAATAEGEDVAGGQASVAAVMQSWMASPPHRANILGYNYGLVGVGRTVRDGRIYWVADFVQS